MRTHIGKTQGSLRVLADATGGFAVVNDNTYVEALARINAETSDYYILGYSPTNPDRNAAQPAGRGEGHPRPACRWRRAVGIAPAPTPADAAQALTCGAMVQPAFSEVPAVRVRPGARHRGAGCGALARPPQRRQRPMPQSAFAEGLAALHSFEYEDANAAFLRAQRDDPGFALAYWGEAMTYHQTLWGQRRRRRRAAGRSPACPRAAPRRRRRGHAGSSMPPRVLFGDGDGDDPPTALRRRDGRVHAADARRSGRGLALRARAARHRLAEPDRRWRRTKATAPRSPAAPPRPASARSSARCCRSHPEHSGRAALPAAQLRRPGARASRGLDGGARLREGGAGVEPRPPHAGPHLLAARAVGRCRGVGPGGVRRLRSAGSKRTGTAAGGAQLPRAGVASVRAAAAGTISRGAARLIDEIAPVVEATGELTPAERPGVDARAAGARDAPLGRPWPTSATSATSTSSCAIGFSAARSGNPRLAELARPGLAGRARRGLQEGDLRPAIAIMEREVAALIALAGGRGGRGRRDPDGSDRAELRCRRRSACRFRSCRRLNCSARCCWSSDRPGEARQAFAQALARNPNRTRSVLGSARAATRLGDADAAREHYRQVLDNYDRADPDTAGSRRSARRPGVDG